LVLIWNLSIHIFTVCKRWYNSKPCFSVIVLQIYLQVKPDLLSRFIVLTEEQPEKYSDKYLRDILPSLVLAGRDTTSVALCWFFHLLCKNPGVEEKLLQEIHAVVKENENKCVNIEESITMFSQSLTHTELNKMHYLHAALSETLRLYPPVPMVRHFCFFLQATIF